jgi:hypothetical protein
VTIMIAAVAAAAIPWYVAVHQLTRPAPVYAEIHPVAVAWGDRVFTNRETMRIWLRGHGISYELWASRHRRAQALLHKASR